MSLLDPPSGLHTARVLAHGAGQPVANMIIAIEGVDEPQIVLAPPKSPPLPGAMVAVRLITTVHGSRYWVLAGQEGAR